MIVTLYQCLLHQRPNVSGVVSLFTDVSQKEEEDNAMDSLKCSACWERDEGGMLEFCKAINLSKRQIAAVRRNLK